MIPEVWMISITGNPISEYYKKYVTPSWSGYKINHFEAVTPETTLNNFKYLNFGKKRDKIDFTETEKACWYSHVECWVIARTRPIIVVEHDVLLQEPIPKEVFSSAMCCMSNSNMKTKQKHAGGAYYLTPEVAKHMVNHVKCERNITYNSDAIIHRKCDEFGVWNQHLCHQYQDREIGFTVEHNKK